MSEFSTGFSFDLQRFATFTGGEIGDETGVRLSDLFDNGKAATKKDIAANDSIISGTNIIAGASGAAAFFWDKSALVTTDDNTSTGSAGKISLVSGKFETVDGLTVGGISGSTGYVVSALTAVDARGIGANGTAKFTNIGNTTVLNPKGTLTIGGTTLKFSGGGSKAENSDYGWDVGTQVSVKGGNIVNVTATKGEEITTADGTVADFSGTNTATFSNKSFNTITTFSQDNAAALDVSDTLGGTNVFLNIDETANNVKDGKAAITTTFDGQAIKSVTFGGTATSVVADISYGGKKNVGNDVNIQGSAINVSNIVGESSTINYNIGTANGNILNVFDVETKSGKTLTVSKTGGANYLIAQDGSSTAATTISIAGETFAFEDAGASEGNGGLFEITKGKVTGFVFRDDGDSITIAKGTNVANFNLYTAVAGNSALADYAVETEFSSKEKLPFTLNVTGSESDYIVSQGTSGTYQIEVFNGAEVGITTKNSEGKSSTVEMEVALNTIAANRKSPASVVITVDENGVLQSIADGQATGNTGENTGLRVSGSTVKITGMNEDNTSSGFAIKIGGTSVAAYVSSGQYEYTREGAKNSTEGVNTIQLTASKDTLATATANTKIYPYEGKSGTLVYGDNEEEYKFNNASGKAFFTVDDDDSLDFVFVEAGDAITIPEGANAGLGFINKNAEDYDAYALTNTSISAVPTVTDGDNYTVTMTTATNTRSATAEFEVSGIYKDATVNFDTATFTYGASGGTFLFSQNGSEASKASGFTAGSGTVLMNAAAADYLSVVGDDNKAVFKIDGTAVGINEAKVSENEGGLTYSKDDNSLFGLTGATVYQAGSITKIYAPMEADSEFTFANDDAESDEDNQVFTVRAFDGDIDNLAERAYFTVDGTKATGFAFASVDDMITAGSFSGITLTDVPTGNSFAAPIVTDSDGNVEGGTIRKASEDYDGKGNKDCYLLEGQNLDNRKVTFDDNTSATFDINGDDTELLFSTAGKMLAIQNLDNENDEVVVENATGSVFIDQREIDIQGGGFKYHMVTDREAAIEDLKASSNVIKADVDQIRTIAGQSGLGDFSFGASSAAKTFSVSAAAPEDNDSVTFIFANKDLNVTGISAVNVDGKGTESVTGALNGLILNGGKSVAVSGGKDDIYTFSGTSFGGLTDGDKVTNAGDMTDFITESDGAFELVGASMVITSDSSVLFKVEGGSALTGVFNLDGAARGDFQDGLNVNEESVKVTGDDLIAVVGSSSKVDAITDVGGGSIALEQIGSATLVATDADGVFDFVEGQQTFTTFSASGTSSGVTFGIEDKKVVSITGIDQLTEGVSGDFSDGIDVDGGFVQVTNNGAIAVISGGSSGVGIFGLRDGAVVGAASGIVAAVSVEEGTFTFADGRTFAVSGDSMVEFQLDGKGNVIGINDLDGEVSGNLNGIVINEKDPEIQVVGTSGENKDLTYSNGLLTGIKDGDTIVSADNVSTVRTATDGTFTFGTQSYAVTGDGDGLDFIVTPGSVSVTGIDGLNDDATLQGALTGLTGINGQSVVVRNDDDFGVVGAGSAGVKEIFNVSGGAEVVYAGGASKVTTDKAGAFTIGGKSFTTVLDDQVEFALDPQGQAKGIQGLSGAVNSDGANFADFTVNGQSFAIAGDEDDLTVIGTSDEQGIAAVAKVGGASVSIIETGGASTILTDKAGKFTFTKGDQSFSTTDDLLEFSLDKNTQTVTEINLLTENVSGNFSKVTTVNNRTFDVKDNDGLLTLTGNSGASGISKVSDVDGNATITNVAGASQVVTKAGSSASVFTFADNSTPFTVEGAAATFDMDTTANAKVKGVSNFSGGKVTGTLGDITVNGQTLAVTGDKDGILSYADVTGGAVLGKVGGDNVVITGTAGASTVELEQDGNYTFGTKAYTFGAGSATVGLNGLAITSIKGVDQNKDYVTGDFTSNISVGGKNVQVLGDSAITVAQENDQLILRDLDDGATIKAADDIFTAITKTAGTFEDTDTHTLTIGNGGASIALDGNAHITGVSGVTGGISGSGLSYILSGVSVISAPDGKPSTNLSYDYSTDVLGGVRAGDTVLAAGSAVSVVADGKDGAYQFGTGDDAMRFTIANDKNGTLEFAVGGDKHTVVSAVGNVDENATLTGDLNGFVVNGGSVSIEGDAGDLGIVGGANGIGIGKITNVGGSGVVTIVEAGDADYIVTDTEGKFAFDKSGQKFTVSGDSSVTFQLYSNSAVQESVVAVDDLDGVVAGDFTNVVAVNGSDIQITNDKNGVVSVTGYDGLNVTSIGDVNAGATIERTGTAAQVNTSGEGTFKFAGNGGQFDAESFIIEGDNEVTFNLDSKGDVAGVVNFTSGKITFDAATSPTLAINPTVNDVVTVSAASSAPVVIEVDSEGRIIGVAGASAIGGLENATIPVTGPTAVNGTYVDIIDADNSFNVEVKDFEVDKITGVTGNATINVADASIEADADGRFYVGDYHTNNADIYTIDDKDNIFGMTTDRNAALSAVSSLEGSIVIENGTDALTVNGNDVEVYNIYGNAPVTISTDGTSITAVDGLSRRLVTDSGIYRAIVEGALDNASIAMASVANDTRNEIWVNDTLFALMGEDSNTNNPDEGYHVTDSDGVTINGKGEIVDLDDGARMYVTADGIYTVNGSTLAAVAGDTIIGAGNEGAYLYDPDDIIVRKGTPLNTIESLTGIPSTVDEQWGSYLSPVSKAELDTLLSSADVDKNRVLDIYTNNPEKVAQDIDLSGYNFTKKVHLFNGDQNVSLNGEGGNLVHVQETYRAADGNDSLTSGKKRITLGNGATVVGNDTLTGGDVVVVDQAHGLGNEVSILGGLGDDTIFVRNNVDTTIDMSRGGEDKVVTFANANARIKLENYNPLTGAGVQFEQLSVRDAQGGIANAIDKGIVDFGDGVVSLTTDDGTTEISINSAAGGTASVGGTLINLFTPEGTRQRVGFTHSAGGVATIDANSTEDVIFIGNKDGKKAGGSVLRGGLGNDVAFAGEGDVIDMGGGLNTVTLQDNQGRKGAYVNISAGNTQIYNTNSTLDEIHGDTLGVDLSQMDLEYDGETGNLIIKSKEGASSLVMATVVAADKDNSLVYDTANTATGADLAESADLAQSADGEDTTTGSDSSDTTTGSATSDTVTVAAAVSLTPDHNYTNALINDNGTLRKMAIGATGSVIDVKLDEDVRANYYNGDDSGLTFYGYNGEVLIDLEGDWQKDSRIDTANVTLEGITSIAAGTGLNVIKGSDNNETFFAGRGNSHLYADGGRNLLVGYTGDDKEGQTTFYVLGNAADAANTIQAFDFVDDDNYTNNNRITADKLKVDLPTNYVNRVELSNNDVVVNVTNRHNVLVTESVLITDVIDTVTGYGRDILIDGDGVVENVIAQVGNDKLKFDKFANYYNAKGKNATVDVANDKDFAQVWLDGSKGVNFQGDIHVINAAEFAGTAELAGNDYNNTIYAGTGAASLWGGHKGDDALVAGTGQDTFFYTIGNGTDTIYGAKDGDIVNLAGVNLSDIVSAEFSNSGDPIQGVALNFRDGGKLYIGDNGGNAVGYVVNGETYFVNDAHNGFEKKA